MRDSCKFFSLHRSAQQQDDASFSDIRIALTFKLISSAASLKKEEKKREVRKMRKMRKKKEETFIESNSSDRSQIKGNSFLSTRVREKRKKREKREKREKRREKRPGDGD